MERHKSVIDLRPVCHHLEQRIWANVLLCRLALLLIRIAETSTGQTRPTLREDLQRLHRVSVHRPAGSFRQRTELTPNHKKSSPRSACLSPAASSTSSRRRLTPPGAW